MQPQQGPRRPRYLPGRANVGIPSSSQTPGPRTCTLSAGWIATWRGRERPGLRAEPGSASPSLRVRRLRRRCAPALARPPPRCRPPTRAPEQPRRLRPRAARTGRPRYGLGWQRSAPGALVRLFVFEIQLLPPQREAASSTLRGPLLPSRSRPRRFDMRSQSTPTACPGLPPNLEAARQSSEAQAGEAEGRARRVGFVCGRVVGASQGELALVGQAARAPPLAPLGALARRGLLWPS